MRAKYKVGDMVMTRGRLSSEHDSDCTMVLEVFDAKSDTTDYSGWMYRVDAQPTEDENRAYEEPCVFPIPGTWKYSEEKGLHKVVQPRSKHEKS